jgi:hypothetical protein
LETLDGKSEKKSDTFPETKPSKKIMPVQNGPLTMGRTQSEQNPTPNNLASKADDRFRANARVGPGDDANKWPNEKQDFFEYLKYALYEDSQFSYKEMSWLRRVLCKFCHLEPPMNSKGKPVSMYFKKDQLYCGDLGIEIDSIEECDMPLYFTGFVKGNGPRKELFYGRLFYTDAYEVTVYVGAFKEKGRAAGKNIRIYSPRGELEFEGEL